MAKDKKEDTYAFVRSGADLERENLILRETISQLKNEVERFREPALMIAELADIIDEHAVIRVPNGNKFFQASEWIYDCFSNSPKKLG